MPERLTPKIEVMFGEWLGKNKIKAALLDLDDTILETNALFVRIQNLFFEFAQSVVSDLDVEEFARVYTGIDTASYRLMGVSPRRWQYIIDELSVRYPVAGLENGISILQGIYQEAPEIFEGAVETLQMCRRAGLVMGLVTHAGQEWTDIKLDAHNLRPYFDHIEVVDIELHRHKGPENWRSAVNKLGIAPANIMVVGDNLNGDIIAAREIGVANLVWIPSAWSVYREGELPEGVIQADSFGNLIPTLVGLSSKK